MLWVLDSQPGSSGNIFGDGKGESAGLFKLVKINTRTHQVERVYLFDDLDKSRSALSDVRVDPANNHAYCWDTGLAAITVMDTDGGCTRALPEDRTVGLAGGISSVDVG